MNKVFIYSVLVLQILGCVKEAEHPSAGSLEGGVWYGDCHQSTAGAYQSNTISFQDGSYLETIKVYTDSGCSQKILEIAEGGSYVIGDDFQAGSKTTELDLTLSKLSLTPSTSEVANTYSIQSMCGISTWEVGKPIEVTGLSCGGETMPAAGKNLFTIYRIYEDSISGLPGFDHNIGDLAFGYTGGTTDGSSHEKRPTSLGSLKYHR